MGWNISHERQQLISSLMTLGAFIGSCSAGMQLKFCVKTHCIDHPRPGSRVHRAQDQSLRCRPPMLRRKHCYDDDYEYGRALRGPSHYLAKAEPGDGGVGTRWHPGINRSRAQSFTGSVRLGHVCEPS